MLGLTKEWSNYRLTAEMEEANVSKLKGLIVGSVMTLLFIFGLFFADMWVLAVCAAFSLFVAVLGLILGDVIFIGIPVFAIRHDYKRNKRYKKLRELWKARS